MQRREDIMWHTVRRVLAGLMAMTIIYEWAGAHVVLAIVSILLVLVFASLAITGRWPWEL